MLQGHIRKMLQGCKLYSKCMKCFVALALFGRMVEGWLSGLWQSDSNLVNLCIKRIGVSIFFQFNKHTETKLEVSQVPESPQDNFTTWFNMEVELIDPLDKFE